MPQGWQSQGAELDVGCSPWERPTPVILASPLHLPQSQRGHLNRGGGLENPWSPTPPSPISGDRTEGPVQSPLLGTASRGWLKGLGSRGRGSRRAVPCLPSPRCSGARPPLANNTDRGAVAGARRGRRCTSPAANGSARSRRLRLPTPPGSVRGTDNAVGGARNSRFTGGSAPAAPGASASWQSLAATERGWGHRYRGRLV